MYEEFYGFARTPFSRDIPPKDLYQSSTLSETLGRLFYVAERQLFCVLTGECGTGKTTAVRRFKEELDGSKYIFVLIILNFAMIVFMESCLFIEFLRINPFSIFHQKPYAIT